MASAGKSFVVKHYYTMHIANHGCAESKEAAAAGDGSGAPFQFRCDVCYKTFVSAEFLKTHKGRHRNRKNIQVMKVKIGEKKTFRVARRPSSIRLWIVMRSFWGSIPRNLNPRPLNYQMSVLALHFQGKLLPRVANSDRCWDLSTSLSYPGSIITGEKLYDVFMSMKFTIYNHSKWKLLQQQQRECKKCRVKRTPSLKLVYLCFQVIQMGRNSDNTGADENQRHNSGMIIVIFRLGSKFISIIYLLFIYVNKTRLMK